MDAGQSVCHRRQHGRADRIHGLVPAFCYRLGGVDDVSQTDGPVMRQLPIKLGIDYVGKCLEWRKFRVEIA